jgi:hypothetical protein
LPLLVCQVPVMAAQYDRAAKAIVRMGENPLAGQVGGCLSERKARRNNDRRAAASEHVSLYGWL